MSGTPDAERLAPGRGSTSRASWPARLAWLSLPLFATAALLFSLADEKSTTDSPQLVMLLNTLFCTAVSLLIAYLAGQAYLRIGSPPMLYLGSGSLVFAGAFVLSGLLIGDVQEAAVMVHNVGVLFAGALFLLSAGSAITGKSHPVAPAAAVRRLTVSYCGASAAMALVLWGAHVHVFPDFYVVGKGMTLVRQVVIGTAAVEYAIAAVCFLVLHRRSGSFFPRWYGLGLALLGMSFLTLMPATAPGSLLSWVGRGGQYLGGFYVLIAVLSIVRKRDTWGYELERALRESGREFQALFDLSSVGMAHADPATGHFTRVNARFCEITGYSRDELLAMPVSALTIPEDRERDRALIERVLRHETPGWTSEKRYQRKDGRVVWVRVTGTASFDAAGRPQDMAAVIEDISRRMAAEESQAQLLRQLQRATVELEAIFAALPHLLSVHGRDGRYLRVNSALLDVFGFDPTHSTREEIAARVKARLPDGRPLTPETMPYSRALRGDAVGEVEYQITDAHGRERVLVVNAVPLAIDGTVDGAVLLQRDVTDQKQVQERIRHLASLSELNPNPVIEFDARGAVTYCNAAARGALLDSGLPDDARLFLPENFAEILDALHRGQGPAVHLREVAIRNKVFSESVTVLPGLAVVRIYALDVTERKATERERLRLFQDLERSNSDLEQFASVASHDLQEPLRAVAGYTELLRDRYRGRLDEHADSLIQGAVDGAVRMRRLIDDLLAYSRIGTRSRPPQTVEPGAALDVALANLAASVAETGAIVTRDTLPTIRADTGQLAQLFQNLVGNALKFRGEKVPRIHVGVSRTNGMWVFSVQDNGIGMDPVHRERIFEIFRRLHPRGKYPGTGIGLAICKRIVERHGGRIWVETAPAAGATFFFTLPADTET